MRHGECVRVCVRACVSAFVRVFALRMPWVSGPSSSGSCIFTDFLPFAFFSSFCFAFSSAFFFFSSSFFFFSSSFFSFSAAFLRSAIDNLGDGFSGGGADSTADLASC